MMKPATILFAYNLYIQGNYNYAATPEMLYHPKQCYNTTLLFLLHNIVCPQIFIVVVN